MHRIPWVIISFAVPSFVAAANVPELYELCKTDAEIEALQATYALIQVSSTPTKAAMHPAWPETLLGLITNLLTFGQLFLGPSDTKSTLALCMFVVTGAFTVVSSISWTISLAIIQIERSTAGWISMLSWLQVVTFLVAATTRKEGPKLPARLVWFAAFFVLFQAIASIVVMAQRWIGDIGTIAYMIDDSGGCVPWNGFGYLERGARSRAFKIIQLAELVYGLAFAVALFISLIVLALSIVVASISPVTGNAGFKEPMMILILYKPGMALLLLLLYVPVLVYEIIIATQGRPVVVSGSCMLVELDPNYGLLNTQIPSAWKALCGIVGL